MPSSEPTCGPTRRGLLATTALAVTAGVTTLAGCSDDSEPTLLGEEFPAVDEWLTETQVGGADDSYDGTLLDARDREAVEVDVGAEGNGGTFAFAPSAVAVSPGTTVRWVWVDDREGHSVVADPDRQLGESDYEFESGGPVAEEGNEYEGSLDDPGVALYHCSGIAQTHWERRGRRLGTGGRGQGDPALHLEPHRKLGMKGGVAVTE